MPPSNLPSTLRSVRAASWLRALAALLVAGLWVKTAWLGDDAFISLRTVDNLLHGHGPVWNVGERVQAFTHPLWLLVLTPLHALVRDPYATLHAASALAAAAAVWLLGWRAAATPSVGAAALAALALSRAGMDYASSGLATPLLYALAAWFTVAWFALRDGEDAAARGRRVFLLVLAGALILLTRLDAVLLVGPPLAVALRRHGRGHRRAVLAGLAPLLAWELFAVVYYGFPVPNTAYAKLETGIPAGELAVQGLRYLALAVRTDPLTPVVVALGALAAWRWAGPGAGSFALGLVLTLVYTVKIGGDFMAGRFLAVPFVLSLALLARRPPPAGRGRAAVLALLAAALLVPRNPLVAAWRYELPPYDHGIADERGYYHRWTGLVSLLRSDHREHEHAAAGRRVRAEAARRGDSFQVVESVGMYGYFAGPHLYVIDRFALANPFLARLPANRTWFRGGWRIGHFWRDLPEGYYDSVGADRNLVRDPELHALYDDVRRVTTGPLLSPSRWAAMLRLWPGGGPGR